MLFRSLLRRLLPTALATMFSPIVLVSDIDSGNLNLTSVCGAGGEDSTDNDFVDEPARRVESIVSQDTNNNDDGKNPIAEVTALFFTAMACWLPVLQRIATATFSLRTCDLARTSYTIMGRVTPGGFVDVGFSNVVCVCDDREHCWYLLDKLPCKDHFVECKLVRGIDKRE